MSESKPWLARLSWTGAGVLLAGALWGGTDFLSPEVASSPVQRSPAYIDETVAQRVVVEAPPLECYLGVVLPRAAVDVVAEGDGRVQEMAIHVGDSVAEGQLLATVESDTTKHQRAIELANLAASDAELKRMTLDVDRADQQHQRRLGLDGLLSREEIAASHFQLDSARASLELAQAERARVRARLGQLDLRLLRSEIRAPFDGTVAHRYLDPGAMARTGMPVLRLISSKGLMARFAVPPGELADLTIGTEVRVEVESLRKTLEGTIEHVMPEIDVASQSIFVEARLATPTTGSPAIPVGAVARVSFARLEESGGTCLGP